MNTVTETSVLDIPLSTLDFPVRLQKMFERKGKTTVGQALTIPYGELAEEKNLGAQSILVWMTYLESHNLCSGRQA
jgi:hypothetical protein